jgi:hypothetical protein
MKRRHSAPLIGSTALVACLAAPVSAQDAAALQILGRGIDDTMGIPLMSAATAVCLANDGDGAALVAAFETEGWLVTTDAEMGESGMTRDGADVFVMMFQDGAICDVGSMTLSTGDAISALQTVAGAAGLALEPVTDAMGCDAYQIAPGITVEITSTGQDPVCQSDTDSTLRIAFIE